MSHRRVYRLFTLWISLLSRLVPRSHRDRWAEERRSDANLRAPTTGAVDRIRQDLRFAARGVRRQPAFAAVAILTLAFGIGINAAMFSIVRAVLLNPLPFADAHELVQVWETRLSQAGIETSSRTQISLTGETRTRCSTLWRRTGASRQTLPGPTEPSVSWARR